MPCRWPLGAYPTSQQPRARSHASTAGPPSPGNLSLAPPELLPFFPEAYWRSCRFRYMLDVTQEEAGPRASEACGLLGERDEEMTYTPRQLQVLKLIHEYHVRNGYAPTYAELAKELGVSTITIFEHMEALERKGAIRRRRHEARSAEIVEPDFLREQSTRKGLPLKGLLNAGSPLIPAPSREEIPLGNVFPWNPNLFALKVRGDALGQQHILDGDLLVLEASDAPAPGDTVLEVHGDGRANLRVYTTEEWRARKGLTSKPPARAASDTRIQGVLRGLIRQTRAQAAAVGYSL